MIHVQVVSVSDTNTSISQGSVASRLRCSCMFYYRFAGNLLLSVLVNEFRKSFSTDKVRGKHI